MRNSTLEPAFAEHDDRSNSIRRRVVAVMAVEFAMLMTVTAIEGFWPGPGPGPVAATGFLFAAMIIVPVAMAAATRPILRDVHHLGEENARLRELYGRARNDALVTP